MKKKIIDFEILDHGVENSQYFQGCGVAFTDFDDCFTGVGSSYKGALDDVLDQMLDTCEFKDIPKELLEELKNADDTDLVSKALKENLPDTIYRVRFSAWNGVTWKYEYTDLSDARKECSDFIASMRRRGASITKLEPYEWEIETSSNREGIAVTDNDGTLHLDIIEPEIPEDHELYYYVSVRIKTEKE